MNEWKYKMATMVWTIFHSLLQKPNINQMTKRKYPQRLGFHPTIINNLSPFTNLYINTIMFKFEKLLNAQSCHFQNWESCNAFYNSNPTLLFITQIPRFPPFFHNNALLEVVEVIDILMHIFFCVFMECKFHTSHTSRVKSKLWLNLCDLCCFHALEKTITSINTFSHSKCAGFESFMGALGFSCMDIGFFHEK